MNSLTSKLHAYLLGPLQDSTLPCRSHLLDCLLSLQQQVFGGAFEPFVHLFIPHLLSQEILLLRKSPPAADFLSRKLSLDLVHSLSLTLPLSMSAWKHELIQLMSDGFRFDRIRVVRDACQEALKAVKGLPEPAEGVSGSEILVVGGMMSEETSKLSVSQDRADRSSKSPSSSARSSSQSSS
jgi:hypothetical protein